MTAGNQEGPGENRLYPACIGPTEATDMANLKADQVSPLPREMLDTAIEVSYREIRAEGGSRAYTHSRNASCRSYFGRQSEGLII
jgi:hypothetical protein